MGKNGSRHVVPASSTGNVVSIAGNMQVATGDSQKQAAPDIVLMMSKGYDCRPLMLAIMCRADPKHIPTVFKCVAVDESRGRQDYVRVSLRVDRASPQGNSENDFILEGVCWLRGESTDRPGRSFSVHYCVASGTGSLKIGVLPKGQPAEKAKLRLV